MEGAETESTSALHGQLEPVGTLEPKWLRTDGARKNKQHVSSTGDKASLPCFFNKQGDVLDDSWSIATKYRGAIPGDLKEVLEKKVGPATRTLVYSFILKPEMSKQFRDMGVGLPAPWWQKKAWSFASPKIAKVMFDGMVKNDEYVAQQRKTLNEAITLLNAMLKERPELFKDHEDGRPSVCAISIASLFAPVVMPDNYSGGLFDLMAITGGASAWPDAFHDMVNEMKATPVGQFTMAVYKRRLEMPAAKNA